MCFSRSYLTMICWFRTEGVAGWKLHKTRITADWCKTCKPTVAYEKVDTESGSKSGFVLICILFIK